MSLDSQTNYTLPAPVAKACNLFKLLAGNELLGLSPGEIAKGLGVAPSWVSVTLPALEAETGFVERVADTNRWRLGTGMVRIALTVSSALQRSKQQLDDLSNRYQVGN
jgi:ArsR family transcriptional regulator